MKKTLITICIREDEAPERLNYTWRIDREEDDGYLLSEALLCLKGQYSNDAEELNEPLPMGIRDCIKAVHEDIQKHLEKYNLLSENGLEVEPL